MAIIIIINRFVVSKCVVDMLGPIFKIFIISVCIYMLRTICIKLIILISEYASICKYAM